MVFSKALRTSRKIGNAKRMGRKRTNSVRTTRSQNQRVLPMAKSTGGEDKKAPSQEKTARKKKRLVPTRTTLCLSRRAVPIGRATGGEKKKAPSQEKTVRSMIRANSILTRELPVQSEGLSETVPMAGAGKIVPSLKTPNAAKETAV